MKKSYLKIFFPALLAILLFILTIFFIIIPRYEQNVMNGKREIIKELTNTAISILTKYESDEKDGKLTREEAQATAISRLQYLRYGEENKDYFWITDTVPVMVMHPFRKDLNGKDLGKLADPHGKYLFVEMVNTVQANEHGYVDYMWQWKDDSSLIVPKLSYVSIFKPWNWVVGTGVYIEDVKKEISGLTKSMSQISTGISVLIASLLLYVFFQGIKTEQRKNKAEEELKKSKDKYLTLVEAATDGLLMVSEGKIIFANAIFGRMSGYAVENLHEFPVLRIIGKNNNAHIIHELSQYAIKDGKYEVTLVKKDGTFFDVLLTSSTALFHEENVNIWILKDITTAGDISFTNVDYQKLISTLNVGFFKANLNAKGIFLFADITAIRILGADNFDELSNQPLANFIEQPGDRKEIIRELQKEGVVKNKAVTIITKRKDKRIVSVSLLTLPDEKSEGLICDGIIEDITVTENAKALSAKVIAEGKSGELLFETPVINSSYPPVLTSADKTIGESIAMLERSKSGCLVLTSTKNEVIGIVTNNDIRNRVIELKLDFDNPSYMIMSSPVVSAPDQITMKEAFSVCRSKNISHLILKNSLGKVTGVFSLYHFLLKHLEVSDHENEGIAHAISVEDLRDAYRKLQVKVSALIQNGMPVSFITGITTRFSDEVVKKLAEFAINELGKPPADFAFICMGSEGRMEETLLTDQDNAIVYDDVPKEMEQSVKIYFERFSKIVCEHLNKVGYLFCKGNIMAMNPQWCKPFTSWLNYFRKWIMEPEPQNLLEATIFFDFRHIYGDEKLVTTLRERINSMVKENPPFLYHMANNTVQLKPLHLPSGNIHADKHTDYIELKSALVPLIMFARTYALSNEITLTSTTERLRQLKEKGVIADDHYAELIFAYHFLMGLRLKTQAFQMQGNEKLSNILVYTNISKTEFYILKKVISDIQDLQIKMKNDFRISG